MRPLPQPPYPPNTPNSFDCKLEGGKEGEAPPNPLPPNTPNSFDRKLEGGKEGEAPPPTPLPRLGSARAICGHLVARCMCVGGGGISSSRGEGLGCAPNIRHSPPILLCAALV